MSHQFDFTQWAIWAFTYLGESPSVVADRNLLAASQLLRQVKELSFPLAIACAEAIRKRVQDKTFDYQRSVLAVVNDRYVLWEDCPDVWDSLSCGPAHEIALRPAKTVRYDPNGHLGALNATKSAQHDAPPDHGQADGSPPANASAGIR